MSRKPKSTHQGWLENAQRIWRTPGRAPQKSRRSRNIISQCRRLPHINSSTRGPPIISTSGLTTHCRLRLIISALHPSVVDYYNTTMTRFKTPRKRRSEPSKPSSPGQPRPTCPYPALHLLSPANGQILRLHSKRERRDRRCEKERKNHDKQEKGACIGTAQPKEQTTVFPIPHFVIPCHLNAIPLRSSPG
ncbi:uncharacterized protein CTRU02_201696 [Colletotrichum truncatum]|uniref:Uncharacterized protein n=1 Tax=Colletotrichum truncatum TaxID=5467 RepID=A0ACC3ZI94_COLTU|nr:uncharacterized protein CTRU02_11582 [Colletotrichum truncatum]KAF6785597.1 hypothetical protein CTRU02_11582 [Colletotrichum truncatum]